MDIRPSHALLVVALTAVGVGAYVRQYNAGDDDPPPPSPAAVVAAARARADAQKTPLPAELLAPPTLADADPFGYPADVTDKRHVLDLLRAGDYATLDRELDSLGRLVASDVRYEYNLRDAYVAFAHTDSTLDAPLAAWAAASPRSTAAHLARAEREIALAWLSRGEDAVSETPESNFVGMRTHLTAAIEELKVALRSDPKAYVAYSQTIEIAQLTAGPAESIVRRALQLYPDSYLLRQDFMETLEPRWGGSYEEMDAFAREAQPRAASNPRLRALLASSVAARARVYCCTDHDLPAALAAYDTAVEIAPEREFLLGRGRIRGQLGDYAGALADFNAAWQQRPQGARTLDGRAKTYLALAARAPLAQYAQLVELSEADAQLLLATTNDLPAALEDMDGVTQAREWLARVSGK